MYYFYQTRVLGTQVRTAAQKSAGLNSQLVTTQKQYAALREQDQYKINQQLKEEIKNIHDTYKQSVATYEKLLDFKTISKDTSDFDKSFAQSLNFLSDNNYASASSLLTSLNTDMQKEHDKIASSFVIPQNVAKSNSPPGSGYSRQTVTTDRGDFLVDIISADLNSTKVIVDTASDGDCSNNCPVLSLADYISRNGAFAGINGSFFCPPEYPSCAGKTNSFDTLLMNKKKTYFNSANNVYSTVPAVIFSGNSARFVGRSLEWGRDTGVDSVIAMQPMLISNNNIIYTDSSDTKFTNKGTRCFVGATGNTVYIGTIYNANMSDSAHILKSLNIANAINLDEGGSTALWANGGYKAGPGRNIPNAVLFVHK